LGLLISLTPSLFIKVPVPNQKLTGMYLCVRVLISHLSTIFLLDFGTGPTVCYLSVVFHVINIPGIICAFIYFKEENTNVITTCT